MSGRRALGAITLWAIACGAAIGASDGFAWRRIDAVHDAVRAYPSPVDPDVVYVWTRDGLVASVDGERFAPLPAAAALGEVTALLIAPDRPRRLYVGTRDHGVFTSDDAGATWRALGGVDRGLADPRIAGLAFGPDDAEFATLVATHSFERHGVSISSDGGASWRAIASDYGAGDCLARGTALFFAGSNAAQGTGFFRFDPSRGWLCLLTDEPRTLVGSRLDPHRVWFGTAGAGLRVSDDFGISMRDGVTGPPAGDIVSIAVGWAGPREELVYAYDPAGEGVMRSRDGFATWERVDAGFGPSEWTRDGACLAADAVGASLWACRNGELWHGAAPRPAPLRAQPRVDPAAVVADDALTITCRAEPGSRLTVDCGELGGPRDLALVEGADGDYAAKLARATPTVLREFALPVHAVRGSASADALAVVTVLPRLAEVPLWNGEAQNNAATWANGGVAIARSDEHPLSPPAHIRITVVGVGRVGLGWNGWGGAVDASRAKFLAVALRSDVDAPPRIRVALRDDGGGAGLANAQSSRELDLARYLPRIGPEYRLVAIPLADFFAGSTCSPMAVRELVVISDDASPRVYDLDDLALMPRSGPRLAGAEACLADDGRTVAFAVTAAGVGSAVTAVSVHVGDTDVALADDGDGRWSGSAPIEAIGRGSHALVFRATAGERQAQVAANTFIAARAPVAAPCVDPEYSPDGGAAEVARAPVLTAASGALVLDARIAHRPRALRVMLDVADAGFTARTLAADADAATLVAGACVELLLTTPMAPGSAAVPAVHRAVFAVGADGGHVAAGSRRWTCAGARTDRGWRLDGELPLEVFDADGARSEAGNGTVARAQLILHGGGGGVASWAGGDGAVEDPERFGELRFRDAPGPPLWRCVAAVGTALTVRASKPLDRPSAGEAANWRTDGAAIVSATLEADARTVRLVADRAWPVGAEIRLTPMGVRAADGAAAAGAFACTPERGLAVGDGFIGEFLVGEVRRGIDPGRVDQPFIDEGQHPARSATWSYVDTDAVVDLQRCVGGEDSVAHAHVYVWSDVARSVQLWVGSDDGVRVAVDGVCVHRNGAARAVTPDQDKITGVPLKPGWNDIMLAITQGGGGWGFCLRIRDDQGRAPAGLRYCADDPLTGCAP